MALSCNRLSAIHLFYFVMMYFYIAFKDALTESTWTTLILAFIFVPEVIQLILLFVLPIRYLHKVFNSDGSFKN